MESDGKYRSGSKDELENFEKFLFHQENYYGSYFAQKERMSWLALIFFGLVAFSSYTLYPFFEEITKSDLVTAVFSLLYSTVFFLIIFHYIRTQTQFRNEAANMVKALRLTVVKLHELEDRSRQSLFRIDLSAVPRKDNEDEIWLSCPDIVYKEYREFLSEKFKHGFYRIGRRPLSTDINFLLIVLYIVSLAPCFVTFWQIMAEWRSGTDAI